MQDDVANLVELPLGHLHLYMGRYSSERSTCQGASGSRVVLQRHAYGYGDACARNHYTMGDKAAVFC